MDKKHIINCPSCGCEYLPVEIYLPNSFFGKPIHVEKDQLTGEIIDYVGDDMDLKETYRCDKCNTLFQIETSISFNTKSFMNKDKNFKTTIKKDIFNLDED